ncbi:hypothetical protein RRG08_067188, partial [Elysia crispata]
SHIALVFGWIPSEETFPRLETESLHFRKIRKREMNPKNYLDYRPHCKSTIDCEVKAKGHVAEDEQYESMFDYTKSFIERASQVTI